jgi:hypothetical protein
VLCVLCVCCLCVDVCVCECVRVCGLRVCVLEVCWKCVGGVGVFSEAGIGCVMSKVRLWPANRFNKAQLSKKSILQGKKRESSPLAHRHADGCRCTLPLK